MKFFSSALLQLQGGNTHTHTHIKKSALTRHRCQKTTRNAAPKSSADSVVHLLLTVYLVFCIAENVNEYLRLSSNADKQQQQRIKQLFEKKNQKSTQNVAQLQRKLENYQVGFIC